MLCARADPAVDRERPDETLHEELAGEGQDDDVEGHEGEVAFTLAIVRWGVRVRADIVGNELVVGRERVGQEDGTVERIAWGRIESVERESEDDKDEGVEPCVVKGVCFPPPDPAADMVVGFPTFRMGAGDFGLGVALREKSIDGANGYATDTHWRQGGRDESGCRF